MIRALQIACASCLGFCLVGCDGREEREPMWEQVKIGDIAPSGDDKRSMAQMLKTIHFGVRIFEIPAENVGALDKLWLELEMRPLRFSSHSAFRANSFSIGAGQMRLWDRAHELLYAAGGQQVVAVSLLLSDSEDNDLIVRGLGTTQRVFYTAVNGAKEVTTVGPGVIALRLQAEKAPGSRDMCTLIGYPVFSVPAGGSIPQLAERAKSREFSFTSAAFALKMAPGDFVALGPDKYISDQTALGGLFFSKPEGSLFFSASEGKPPESKPAVSIFLLICTRINY